MGRGKDVGNDCRKTQSGRPVKGEEECHDKFENVLKRSGQANKNPERNTVVRRERYSVTAPLEILLELAKLLTGYFYILEKQRLSDGFFLVIIPRAMSTRKHIS